MEKVTFYGEIEGISLEQMVRYGKFDMRVKHFHNQYEIFYIIEGERLFFFNNREYVARSGDLILVDTNLIHMTKSVTAEDTGHNRVILYVSYDRMKAFDGQYPSLQLVRFFHEHYGVYHLDKEQQALFLNFYRNLRIAMTEKAHNYKVGIDLETLTWLFKITSYVSKQEGASPTPQTIPNTAQPTPSQTISPKTANRTYPWRSWPHTFISVNIMSAAPLKRLRDTQSLSTPTYTASARPNACWRRQT